MALVINVLEFFLDFRARLWGTRLAILGCALALTLVSVLFVNSTSVAALDLDPFPLSASAWAQVAKALVGLTLLLALIAVDYRVVDRYAYTLYGLLLLVLLLLLTAREIANVKRWITLGALNVQPSEFMKLMLVVALASYLRFRKDQRRLAGLLAPFGLTMVPMALVVVQPDLGTSLMLPPVLLAMLYVAGARRLHLGVAIIGGALLFSSVIVVHSSLPKHISGRFVQDYQADRIYSWLGLETAMREDADHQLRQSRNAIIAGGLTGQGYARGTRNRLNLLPARRTDFIFPVICEEWGFRGGAAVIVIYLTLVLLCLRVSIQSREPFGRLCAAGIGTLFAVQGLQNLSMTMGVTPITGLPLPFVSFGGSSLVASYMCLGLVLSIARRPVLVMASQDLNPRDVPRMVPLVDPHPAGANRFPNGPY